MPTNVILPALGMAQDTGKILEWLKTEGDEVRAGEAIAVIETDKAALDLEAPASGVLVGIKHPAGSEVPVGQVIASILAAGEAASGGQATGAGAARPYDASLAPAVGISADGGAVAPSSTPISGSRVSAAHQTAAAAQSGPPAHGTSGRVAASPKARRLAAVAGMDVHALHGTGPGGAVIAADLPIGASTTMMPSATLVNAVAPADSEHGTGVSTLWRIMAERTTNAWTTTPHFFLTREINASTLKKQHHRLYAPDTPREQQTTITDLLVQAVAQALKRHPRMRAQWQNGAIVPSDEVNIGLAVATEQGLVVPVIHNADDLSAGGIAKRRRDLVTRAQAARLRPSDLEGGVFTISNLGMYGIDAFTAIINGGQAAILAVGRIADRVVPVNGQPGVQPMLVLTLSCDHRVVDGARGAQFLATLADLLERQE